MSPLLTPLALTPPLATPTGILLPDSVLASTFFAIFSAFVGINTVIYVVLAVTKILPKIYLTDLIRGRNRRATARSIYGVNSPPAQVQPRGMHSAQNSARSPARQPPRHPPRHSAQPQEGSPAQSPSPSLPRL